MQKCPNCGIELKGLKGEDKLCPACGHRLELDARARVSTGPDRRWLWWWFWGVFIGAPALAILSGLFQQGEAALPIMLVGTLVSGFLLAAITKKSSAGFVPYALLYSGGLLIVYLGIAFVGCLVAMSGQHI